MKRILPILLLLCCSTAFADEPKPVTDPVPSVRITAPKECEGDGSKKAPFVFTTSTKCILRLSSAVQNVKWDLSDSPDDVEILENRYLGFSLMSDGIYQAIAYGDGVYSKVWFVIKSGTDPPVPPTPGPTPEPTPPPAPPVPTAKALWIVTVEPWQSRDLNVGRLMGDKAFWDTFTIQGHMYSHVDSGSDAAKKYAAQAEKAKNPQRLIVLMDKNTLKVLTAEAMPENREGIEALVKKYSPNGGK